MGELLGWPTGLKWQEKLAQLLSSLRAVTAVGEPIIAVANRVFTEIAIQVSAVESAFGATIEPLHSAAQSTRCEHGDTSNDHAASHRRSRGGVAADRGQRTVLQGQVGGAAQQGRHMRGAVHARDAWKVPQPRRELSPDADAAGQQVAVL